jgi:hypothetical protein
MDFRGLSHVMNSCVSGTTGEKFWGRKFISPLLSLIHSGGLQLLFPEFFVTPTGERVKVSGTGESGQTTLPRRGFSSAGNTERRMTRMIELLRGLLRRMRSL